jgi:hypothetical protein
MQKEIEDLGGDPTTLGGGRPRGELLSELASAKAAAAKAEKGLFVPSVLCLSASYTVSQIWQNQKLKS